MHSRRVRPLVLLAALAGAALVELAACDDELDGAATGFGFDASATGFDGSASGGGDGSPALASEDAASKDDAGGVAADAATGSSDAGAAGDATTKDAGALVDAGALLDADVADACVDAAIVPAGPGLLKAICLAVDALN